MKAFDQPQRSLSVRGYLFGMVIAILLPVLLFAALLFWRYYDSELTRIEQDLQNDARELALIVDRDLQGQLLVLETLVTSGSITNNDYVRLYQHAARIRDFAGVNILLRDKTGQQLINTRVPWGTALPRDPAEGDDEVVKSKKPYISNVIVGTVARRPIYFITVPILADGEVAYFLHLSLELERLVQILDENISPGRIAGMVDRNDVIMARTEGSNESVGKHASKSFLDRIKGSDGSFLATGVKDQTLRVGYAKSQISGWLIWVAAPEGAIQSSLLGALWALTALGVALTVLAAIGASLLAGKLAGAIGTLAAQANALGRGEAVAAAKLPVQELNDVGSELAAASARRKELEQQLVERATQESEQRFKILVEGVSDYAIYMLNPEGNVTNWNAGAMRIKGYAADEAIGQHFSRFYTSEERERGIPARELEIAATTGKYEAEGRRQRKDGSQFWASVVIDRILDANGKLVGFAKITRDITERREVQQRLERTREQLYQLQKMDAVGQLTGGVAHDFNNLLTIILGNLDTAKRTLETWQEGARARLQRAIDQALIGAQRAATLTGRLLAFSRRQPLEPKIIDINKLLKSAIGILETIAWRGSTARSRRRWRRLAS